MKLPQICMHFGYSQPQRRIEWDQNRFVGGFNFDLNFSFICYGLSKNENTTEINFW